MVMPNHPQPPAPPARPPQPAQPAKPSSPPPSGLATEPQPPQKYDRPLPQPGDKDYVVGQPIDDEEADKVEKEQNERFAAAQKSAHEAEARRRDEEKGHEKD
jgi:hypothetical protein